MGVCKLMQNTLISIIVPAYNVKGYIERTLESICKQSYQNLEIIVVDDGSTDGTQDVIKKVSIKDNRIRAYFKNNEGVTKARMYGVERANGDWVGFVDADDLLASNMYETLLFNALQYKADISHCGYKMVFPDREILHYGTGKIVEQDTNAGLKDLLEGSFVEPGLCNKLFKRDLFEQLDSKMDYSITNLEDLLMNFYLFGQSRKSVFFDECYYYYMIRKNSAATRAISIQKLDGPTKVFKIIKDECLLNSELREIVDRRLIGNLLQILLISPKNSSNEIRKYCKQAKKDLKSMRPKIKKGNYSLKMKLLSFLAVNFPILYRLLHSIYSKIVGNNKKYKI